MYRRIQLHLYYGKTKTGSGITQIKKDGEQMLFSRSGYSFKQLLVKLLRGDEFKC